MTDGLIANPTIGLSVRGGVKDNPGTREMKGVDFDLQMGRSTFL